MKGKMILAATLAAAVCGLYAAPQNIVIKADAKGKFLNWTNRSGKGDFAPLQKDGRTNIRINASKKITNISYNEGFRLDDFIQLRVRCKFTGKGTLRIGIHSYNKEKKYTGTFTDGKKNIVSDTPKEVDNLVIFGKYGDITTKDDERPYLGYPCIYAYPGTEGVISDVTVEIVKMQPDTRSLIAPERKLLPGELPFQHRLVIPDEIYAVQGLEMNVYFDNIFLTVNPDNYVFDVDCPKGHNYKRRWSFTPGKADAGKTYKWTLKVISDQGLVAKKTINLHVVPANAGEGKKLSLLMLGDSIIDVTTYPRRVHKLFQAPGNPKLTMVGDRGKPEEQAKGMRHQGHAGWAFATFLAKGPLGAVDKRGEFVLDIPGYFKRVNGGKAPDVIAVQLGVNDIFGGQDFRLYSALNRISGEMDILIGAFRKAAPNSQIVICLITPCANADGIGQIYRCNQTKYQYTKNRFMLSNMMMEKYVNKDPKISVISLYHNLDCENNFPMGEFPINGGNPEKIKRPKDGLHPSDAGGNQLGDTLYSYLKYYMSKKK